MTRIDEIALARSHGYSDEEIWKLLSTKPDIQKAYQYGYAPEQVKAHLGLELNKRETAEVKRLENAEKLRPFMQQLKTIPSGAVKPFKRMVEIYAEEMAGGKAAMKEALKPAPQIGLTDLITGEAEEKAKQQQSIWKRLFNLGMGGLQYSFSPLTAIARATGETVVEDPLKAVGVPENVARFGGQMGEAAVDLLLPGGIADDIYRKIPQVRKVAPTAISIEEAKEAVKRTKAIKPPIEKPPRPDIFKGQEKILSKGVAEHLIKKATDGADAALKANFDKSRRIFHQIADNLRIGEINVEDLPDVLRKYNLTPEQFAEEYRSTISRAGRTLKYHSDVAKRLNKIFQDNPEALRLLNEGLQHEKRYASDIFFEIWRKADNPRRAFLVTQLATAARNALSQAGRITIGAFDDAFQAYAGGASTKEAIKDGLTLFSALKSRMSPSGWKRLTAILEAEGAGIAKGRLISQPVHEVTMGSKLAHFVNIFNRTQEYFFRKLAFESKLRQRLRQAGLDYNTIDPKKIPGGMVEEAVDYALEMSFAAGAKGHFAKDFIRIWSQSPLTTINPFPRFAFANALPFIIDHSPLGFARALGPKALEELASGNARTFAKRASRATIGTLLMESAWQIRQSSMAGDRWYEIKVGQPDAQGNQRVIDVRAYAPLSSYLFFAEAFLRPERLKKSDYAEAAIGLNRISGSGLVLIDLLRGRTGEEWNMDLLKRVAGAYLGSYTVPMRTPKDIISKYDEEEGVYRNTRIEPFFSPLIANVPYLSRMLPEAASPITAKRLKPESPVLKQTTGLTERIKNPVNQAIDSVGLDWSYVYPSTGIPEADWQICKLMGPLVDKYGPSLVTNPNYIQAGNASKKLMLNIFFKAVRQKAKTKFQAMYPNLQMKIRIQGIPELQKKLFQERLGIDLDKWIEE